MDTGRLIMGKRILIVILLAMMIAHLGCAYVNVKTPYDMDLDQTVLGDKMGRSSCYSVLWLIAWGDAGTGKAAENGGITVLNHMDVELMSVLFGLYVKKTTIVYGE